jgi:hypothetical protein
MIKALSHNRATKTVASVFGVLVGLAGIQHGIFEILQGNTATNDIMIDAIGPDQRVWEFATETALTIIPNFLITGVLAVFFGLMVTIWAGAFINKRYGVRIFGILSLILWLVGGGFAPIFMSILGFAAATRINNPLKWWHEHLPINLRGFFYRLWPWTIIIYVLVFAIGVEIAIFGYPLLWIFNADITYTIQWTSALIMVMLWPISIITALAYDIQKKDH